MAGSDWTDRTVEVLEQLMEEAETERQQVILEAILDYAISVKDDGLFPKNVSDEWADKVCEVMEDFARGVTKGVQFARSN